MVKIKIEEEARDFILKKNANAVTIKMERFGGG